MLLMPGRGMNHQAGRLVERQQGFIFVENLQGQLFGLRLSWTSLGPMNLYSFSRVRRVCGFYDSAIDLDFALFDEPLDGATGNRRKLGAQKGIQARGRERFLNYDG